MREVIVDRRILNGFRRRALAKMPNEYMETIVGKVRGSKIYIFALQDIPHLADRNACYYDTQDIKLQDEDAAEEGMQLLGSLHSHPECPACPSEADLESSVSDGELIMGICSIWKTDKRRRTEIKFWEPSKPLTVKLT